MRLSYGVLISVTSSRSCITGWRLIELRHQLLLKQLGKHDTLSCGTFCHA